MLPTCENCGATEDIDNRGGEILCLDCYASLFGLTAKELREERGLLADYCEHIGLEKLCD